MAAVCLSATSKGVTGGPAAHHISPGLWPPPFLGKKPFLNLEQVAGREGGSGIAKTDPEHPLGQPVSGRPWVASRAWTAGVRLQASASGPGVTAWQAQALLQTLFPEPGGPGNPGPFLGPARPFPEWPLDGAVAPWSVFTGGRGPVLPVTLDAAAGRLFWAQPAEAQPPGAQSPCRGPSVSPLTPRTEEARGASAMSPLPVSWRCRRSSPLTSFFLKPLSFFSCFDLFTRRHHVSAVLLIAIYRVRGPRPRACQRTTI